MKRLSAKFWLIVFLVSVIRHHHCVEVHFEATDSGFFLKHSRAHPVTPEISNVQLNSGHSKSRATYDSVLSVDRFTIVQTTEPVSIRASYGPFSTKQTIPARFIVPDVLEDQADFLNNTTAALMELQQSNTHLDISAHLVQTSIPQDSPILRVLFHAGSDPGVHLQRQKICILLHASMSPQISLKGHCIPEGEDGVCVAEVVIPHFWWPELSVLQKRNRSETPVKVPQRYVQVSYSVFEPPMRNAESCEPKVQIQPLSVIGQVPLVVATTPFKELRADDNLSILLAQNALYPLSKIHVPVVLYETPGQNIVEFTMRARVKTGIKILGASCSSHLWDISVEKENSKHTTARVTATKKKIDIETEDSKESMKNYDYRRSEEIFYWLLEIVNDNEENDGGKIVWSITYVYDNSKLKNSSSSENIAVADDTKRRLIAKLQTNKDDIQAVLPMSKKWELMNTAVLTGRQVAQAIKIFIVSQAGKVADVTLQSSCHAEDESVIKVSSSCSSVYVDGSEIRGSSNASIIVKYGTYIGIAKFIVWMPELPLEVYIPDFRLSQIKGWKVLDDSSYMYNKQNRRRKKRSIVWNQQNFGYPNSMSPDKMTCKTRYQQSPVDVYARFLAVDQNSGRISYFISRRTGLRVTDLVQPLLRVADPKIASLKGRILQGKSMGRTDIQVLSPITGRVIGAKEVRVGSDKVSLSKLIVRVVSGLQLTILPDNTIDNGYIAETFVTHRLTAQYQEGLLDIDLEFSDGFKTPLRDVSVQDYFLLVESLDTEVVAFAPMLASHHPRVIAVGEGNGNLLKVTLLLSDECRSRRNGPVSRQNKLNAALGSSFAPVEVNFSNVDSATKYEPIQNDGIISRDRKGYRDNGDLSDIIVGIPSRDAARNHEQSLQGGHARGSIHSVNRLLLGFKGINGEMTSVEVGMYILLTAFCFAIIIFVISCFVYASKFRPITFESDFNQSDNSKGNFNTNILLNDAHVRKEPTANAHDWVWLGRSTMDREAPSQKAFDKSDTRMRITCNPISSHAKMSNPPIPITSFSITHPDGSGDDGPTVNLTKAENMMEEKPNDYRPPVPPHRNIEVRQPNPPLNGSHLRESLNCDNKYQHHNHQRQHYKAAPEENLTTIVFDNYAVMQNKSKRKAKSPSSRSDGDRSKNNEDDRIHNAEKLVESSCHNNKTAFQFDSIKPKTSSSLGRNEADQNECYASNPNPMRRKSKRATIVGNPTFSNNVNYDNDAENLGLDDLDMDYEQIMQYFDNLKESNA